MRCLPSFKCCIGKTGIALDLLSEISSIFTGLHSEIFKWQQPSKHNFYQVFLHFLTWHPSNGVCCISCPSAALIQSYFCNTPNWQWIEDWLFPGFFAVFSWTWIEDCHQISLQESLETPWSTTLATWISSIWTTGGWDAEFASSIWKIGVISSIFESFSIYIYILYILVWPPPSNSDKIHYVFNREPLWTFIYHCYWEGATPKLYIHIYNIYIYMCILHIWILVVFVAGRGRIPANTVKISVWNSPTKERKTVKHLLDSQNTQSPKITSN